MHKKCWCKDRIFYAILISYLILLTFSSTYQPSLQSLEDNLKPKKTFSSSLDLHGPISISSDDDFVKLGFEGNGTETNPYIIENLFIENDEDYGICIRIVSTSAFFVIQNCELTTVETKKGTGVYLEKVENGAIVNSTFRLLTVGISGVKSEQCELRNNTFYRLEKGVYLTQSLWMNIKDNHFSRSEYGIHFYKMDYSDIISNSIEDCTYGTLIGNSVEIRARSNLISDSFFGLYFHNTIRCKSYMNLIRNSQYGGYIAYSTECNITSSELTRSKYGISLFNVDGGTISSNLVKFNYEFGIHIKDSSNLEVQSNIVFENSGVGVYLIGVSGVTIHNNEIGYNTGTNGADFKGFVTKGFVNNWDTNAWSDYDGTLNYRISGDRGSLDNDPHYILYIDSPSDVTLEAPASGFVNWTTAAFRPSHFSISLDGVVLDEGVWDGSDRAASFTAFDPGIYQFSLSVNTTSGISQSDEVIVNVLDTTPPEWVQTPEDQTIECGISLSYQLEASDYYGIERWWVNNTEFTIDDGLLQSVDSLNYGVYKLEVRAYDPSENFVSHVLTITATDSILPSVDSPPDVIFFEGETGYAILWNVYDSNPVSYEILLDGTSIESGEWTSDMTSIQYSLDGMPSGQYLFSIVLIDIAGNSKTDDVQVTIEESPTTEVPTTSPGTTEIPTTTSGTESPIPTGLNPATLSLIGLGIGVVVVIVLIVIKRK